MGKLKDSISNGLDKFTTHGDRVRVTVDRINYMLDNDLSPAAAAQIMTDNSKNGHVYTPEQVLGCKHLYEDCASRPLITVPQAKSAVKVVKDLKNDNAQPVFEND